MLQLNGQSWPAAQAFYQMTLGNARALSARPRDRLDRARAWTPTSSCSIRAPRPAMAHRMETVQDDLDEELFVLMTLGDDRVVRQTYVAGEPKKA